MSRARTLANLGTVTSSSTELNLLDGQTDIASQAELDAVSTTVTATVTANESEVDTVKTNLAMLAFRQAVDHSDVKYDLQDQIVDEYTDATGVDATPSTNHILAGGVYRGEFDATPTNNATSSALDGSDRVLKWTAVTSSGNLQFASTTSVEYLIVAGGGSGGYGNAGGGGAGGYLANGSAALSLTGGNAYTITVGAGGASVTSNVNGLVGNNSVMSGTGITTLTAGGGGYGGGGAVGGSGGSGGGAGYNFTSGGGAASGIGLGFRGGHGAGSAATAYGAGGGGGASAVGETGTGSKGGDGGIGLQNDITGTNTWYAGGGGGAANSTSAASGNQSGTHGGNQGGGGRGSGADEGTSTTYNDAVVNTGGGGGAGHASGTGNSGDGGTGIVVIRIPNPVAVGDLILQSSDTTAEAAPTKADMVMLIEDAGSGVGTVNTHIKGHISRDSGTTFTEGVLVDEGDWGTDKRILAFHDLDISSQPADQTMCYKITTHSASAVYDTRIHATSIGWR